MAIDFCELAKMDVKASPRTKFETALVRRVARKLGNTIATCRKYYIHPKVLSTLVESRLDQYLPEDNTLKGSMLSKNERIAMNIISEKCDLVN